MLSKLLYASESKKPNHESGFTLPDPTKATTQTGIRYPTMPSLKHWQHFTPAARQETTSISLKPKGLGGALDPPRGACSRTDNPRSTSPFLVFSAYIPPSSAYPVKAL